eukprot:290371-Rhodomonas_salina.2
MLDPVLTLRLPVPEPPDVLGRGTFGLVLKVCGLLLERDAMSGTGVGKMQCHVWDWRKQCAVVRHSDVGE